MNLEMITDILDRMVVRCPHLDVSCKGNRVVIRDKTDGAEMSFELGASQRLYHILLDCLWHGHVITRGQNAFLPIRRGMRPKRVFEVVPWTRREQDASVRERAND